MVDPIERVQRRKKSEDRAEAGGLELASGNEIHRARRGRGRVGGNSDEAEHDVHGEPHRARALRLEEGVHAGEIARHGNERCERRGHECEAHLARQTLDDHERQG